MLNKKLKLILKIVGVTLLLLGIMALVSTLSGKNESITTIATVIDHKRMHKSRNNTSQSYQCVLEYKHKNGKMIVFTQSVGRPEPSYDIGEKVEIIYNPNKKDSHQVNALMDIYFFPGILLFFGMGLTIFGFSDKARSNSY